MGVHRKSQRAIAILAWDSVRFGVPPKTPAPAPVLSGAGPEGDGSSVTGEEAALAEVGAIAVAAALEASAVRGGRQAQAAAAAAAVGLDSIWAWLCWRLDACTRAAEEAGTPQSGVDELRNLGVSLLEPYRSTLESAKGVAGLSKLPSASVQRELLRVRVTDQEPAPPWAGQYALVRGEEFNSCPLYRQRGGGHWLFSGTNGHWYIGDSQARDLNFKAETGVVRSREPHLGCLPDGVKHGSWQRRNAGDYEDDKCIEVLALDASLLGDELAAADAAEQKHSAEPGEVCTRCFSSLEKGAQFCLACGQRRAQSPSVPPAAVRALAFSDASASVAHLPLGSSEMFDALDVNNDGTLTREEFSRLAGMSQGGGVGQTQLRAKPSVSAADRKGALAALFDAFDIRGLGTVDLQAAFAQRHARQAWPKELAAELRQALEAGGSKMEHLSREEFVDFFDKGLPEDAAAFRDAVKKFTEVAYLLRGELDGFRRERRVGLVALADAFDVNGTDSIDSRGLEDLMRQLKPPRKHLKWTDSETLAVLSELKDLSPSGNLTKTDLVQFLDGRLAQEPVPFWDAVGRLTELAALRRQQSTARHLATSIGGPGGAAVVTVGGSAGSVAPPRQVWILQDKESGTWSGPFSAHAVLGMVQRQELQLEAIVGGLDGPPNVQPSGSSGRSVAESLSDLGALARKESEIRARQVVAQQLNVMSGGSAAAA
eukprot:TRINITY_DN8502_c0_g1_i1.p1 TRINITY_DN8502_c0_g1~~TRINITY_DN8502_c0_g1_i1.p1  ORF type:complete len:753 (+),score=127.16 TRINITY_DN8502_c0_g1_i1:126-2261(+)